MILVISQQIKILFRIGIIRIEEKLFDSIAIYLSNYYYEFFVISSPSTGLDFSLIFSSNSLRWNI